MDIGSILLILALAALVIYYITLPFRQKSSVFVSQEEHEISTLLAERDQILTFLMELDFDYDLDKIPEDIYTLQRTDLLQRGEGVLRELDILNEDSSKGASSRLKETLAPSAKVQKESIKEIDDPIEAAIAARKASSRKEASFCHNCGTKIQANDQFCVGCGTKIN